MVNVNIKTTNGAKAKAASSKRKQASVTKARATVLAAKRGANVRTGGFVGIEKKFVDSTSTSTAFTTAWAILAPTGGITDCLSAPGIGTSESQRDGRVFTIHSIHLKGSVTRPTVEAQAGPQTDIDYRLCVVWDTQTNGAPIVGTSEMDAGATNDIHSFRNLQNSKRFIVLWDSGPMTDSVFQMNEGAVNSFASALKITHFSMNKSFKNGIKVRTIGTTADVASISDNSISLIGLASDVALDYNFESRCRFTG